MNTRICPDCDSEMEIAEGVFCTSDLRRPRKSSSDEFGGGGNSEQVWICWNCNLARPQSACIINHRGRRWEE